MIEKSHFHVPKRSKQIFEHSRGTAFSLLISQLCFVDIIFWNVAFPTSGFINYRWFDLDLNF